MTSTQMTNEIRDLNLSYLMLAQSLIRADKAQALYRLGITEDVADLVAQMSPQQLVRVASRNVLLCSVRFGDELIWGLLTDGHSPRGEMDANVDRLHASVLMAGQVGLGLAN